MSGSERICPPGRIAKPPGPDTDLLRHLETVDQLLSAILHESTKYRALIRASLTQLRAGADPGPLRAVLEPWRRSLMAIKRMSRDL